MKRSERKQGGGSADWDDWDDNENTQRSVRSKPEEEKGSAEPAGEGTVIGVARARANVVVGDRVIETLLSPDLERRSSLEMAVGDRVRLERLNDTVLRVAEILPRSGVLSRPDPHHEHRERVIAANIDTVVNVVTLKEPPLAPRLIDRYLAAARRGGCELVVCVNKIDLVDAGELREGREKLATYSELGAQVIECSAITGQGLGELRRSLQGCVGVLSGHSGVGKTSLINALFPKLKLRTNTLHKQGSAGRHTTTASTLFRLDEETSIIDTPGIREFGMWRLDRRTLAEAFDDFADEAAGCKFTDCTHTHEPKCSVREAVEEGRVSRTRYESYKRLFEELEK